MTKYICNICKNFLPTKDLRDIHEELAIKEGIYHQMILKDDTGYLLFKKSNEISINHERIYSVSKFFKIQEKGGIGRHLKKYSYSEIDKKLKDKEFSGLNKEEFESVINFLGKNHFYHEIKEFKNLEETINLISIKKKN